MVLHRRIEDLLHIGREAVDLVDEEDVARFEVGQDRGKVAGLGDDRAGGGADPDAEFAGDDLGKPGNDNLPVLVDLPKGVTAQVDPPKVVVTW